MEANPTSPQPWPFQVVTAYVRQVLPEPPGDLRRWLVPVVGATGEVLDFELDTGVLVANLEPGRIGAVIAAHRRWQRRRGHVVPIDEVGEVRQLAVDADKVGLGVLAGLTAFPCDVTVEDLGELELECQEAVLLLAGIDKPAWEFFDEATGSSLRASAPDGPARLGAGDEPVDWEIELSPSRGLRVRIAGDVRSVDGWTLGARGLRVRGDGNEWELHGPAAGALARLAPGSVHVGIRPVGVADAHAGRLGRLRRAARAGTRAEAALVLVAAAR